MTCCSRITAALVAASALLALAHSARADVTRYQDYPIGARASVLGGAFCAISDDASGLTYNPAGIVDSSEINVSVSASLYGLESEVPQGVAVLTPGAFSLNTLASLSVIPGEAGSVKTFGPKESGGSKYAYGFDLTVPDYREYGTSQTSPSVQTDITDRTFDGAAGFAMRVDRRWSWGVAGHFTLRQFTESESALVTNGAADPTLGVYQAKASFSNGALSLTGGTKLRMDGGWTYGLAVSTAGLGIYSNGSVAIQDAYTNPSGPPPHTVVKPTNTQSVGSEPGIPFSLRTGVAYEDATHWTLSGQLTLEMPITYSRFQLDPSVAERLEVQTRIHKHAVLNLNVGGEYLINSGLSVGGGFFTDFSATPALATNPDGSLTSGSSRLDNISLYGGTAALSVLGAHSVSRFGVSLAYGTGETAVPVDPTGTVNPEAYTRSAVSQLFLYFFLAGSFKY